MYLKYLNAWHSFMVLGQITISTVLKIDEIKKAPFCQVSTWLGKNVMIRDVKIIEFQIIDLTPFFTRGQSFDNFEAERFSS